MERTFMKGCEAIAEAAVRAGCRFFAGYPITPQNEIPEYFSRRMPEVKGIFVQGESEVASVNMLYGAAGTGIRCMTSSSSCGIALKAEGLSYMAGARVPAVIGSVMRGGPGVGTIQPAQQDYFQATKALGNGGFQFLVFAPSTMQEAIDMTYEAFDYADKYRNPVMVLLDGFIGAMMEPVVLPDMKSDEEIAALKKGHQTWALTGREAGGPAHQVTPTGGKTIPLETHNKECAAMYAGWADTEARYAEYMMDDAEVVIAAYGISARISESAIDILREEGYKIGMIRPQTVNPFPYAPFRKLDPKKIKGILDVELSIPAQLALDVELGTKGAIPISYSLRSGGEIHSREDIINAAKKIFAK